MGVRKDEEKETQKERKRCECVFEREEKKLKSMSVCVMERDRQLTKEGERGRK